MTLKSLTISGTLAVSRCWIRTSVFGSQHSHASSAQYSTSVQPAPQIARYVISTALSMQYWKYNPSCLLSRFLPDSWSSLAISLEIKLNHLVIFASSSIGTELIVHPVKIGISMECAFSIAKNAMSLRSYLFIIVFLRLYISYKILYTINCIYSIIILRNVKATYQRSITVVDFIAIISYDNFFISTSYT